MSKKAEGHFRFADFRNDLFRELGGVEMPALKRR